MQKTKSRTYLAGFVPYAAAAFLIGIVGGFTSVLGPAFVRDLGLDYNNTAWTALAMAISAAAFAPILGRLGDVIGRRLMLLIGVLTFTLGNVLTAIAPSLWFMLVARFVVGAGSAAIAPVVIAYILSEFPPEKISGGFSLYMLISSAAVIFGPTLGGIIVDRRGWRVMMWICVAISIAVFFVCLASGREGKTPRGSLADFDAAGSVFVLIFFSLMLCAPSFAQNLGWTSPAFLALLAGAVVSLVILVAIERRATSPILWGRFMKRRSFVLSAIALFLTQGLMQANMTNVIVFVNYTQPDNAVISGYAISIMYVGMSLGSVLLGPLADRLEPKRILAGSFAVTGVGCALMLLFSPTSSLLLIAASLGVLGFGLGANATVFMRVVLSGEAAAKGAGSATGTYGLFRDLAAPFGVAVFVPLFTNGVTRNIQAGFDEASAALSSMKTLAITEIICVAAGIIAVALLPKIHDKRGKSNETEG